MTARSALAMAGFSTMLLSAAASHAGAQRQQLPGPDTRRVLVTAFRGDVEGGVKTANEIRDRIASEFSIKQLMPRSKKDIDNALLQSGYKPDSALSASDVLLLAKTLSIDEILDGSVEKTANGYRVNVRLFMPRDVALSQPLLIIESNNLGDVAKQVVREYESARKQFPATQECENGIRANNQAAAIAGARKGIAAYPKATLSRLCLAQAFQLSKTSGDSLGAWRDSVVAVTNDVLNLDWNSKIAYALKYDAYKTKGDTTKAIEALVGMIKVDPANTSLRMQFIAEVMLYGRPQLAIDEAKKLVGEYPNDPLYLRTHWQVLRANKRYKESVPVGLEYVRNDSAAADSSYFIRQIQDLAADSNFAGAADLAATAVAKFPTNAFLFVQKAQNERRAGKPSLAKTSIEAALKLEPKYPDASLLLAQIANDLGNHQDAVAAVKADVANDASNRERDAQFLFGMGQQSYKAFTASKKPDDYKKTMELLSAADEIFPAPKAKLFMGLTGFAMLQVYAETLPTSRVCADFKAANDVLTSVAMNLPQGARENPEAARQILAWVPQFQAYVDGAIKTNCRP